MKVTSVSLISNDEEALRFDLRKSTESSKFIVRTILGLDAEELVPKFYGFSKSRKRFYDFKLKPRDIVMRIVLNPSFRINETHSDIRDELYRTISATRYGEVELQFNNGASIAGYLRGFITKFEVPHFSKTPELQMTIQCDYPMIKGIAPIYLDSDEVPTTNQMLIYDNQSTAPHGFQMMMTINDDFPALWFQDKADDSEWTFKTNPADFAFEVGDVIHFSSQYKDKYLYVVRDGLTIIHLMDRLEPNSVWPILFPGSNSLYMYYRDSVTINEISFEVTHWGV